jgi:SH3-like domain-containing protein
VARGAGFCHLASVVSVLALVWGSTPARAAEPNESDTTLKVPRFVSLHSDKVNLRSGPGRQYPIEWVLTRKDMPVEVIAQFEHWRRVREWDGTVGWVQEHMITGKRYAIVANGAVRGLYRDPDAAAGLVAKAEPGVIGRLLECKGAWCRIDAGDATGWMRRADLWGVYPDEAVP